MEEAIKIWHHGLVARWWAEFNEGGEDVEYFKRAILASGQPALDAGCGTGRLLIPFVRDGLDVDGSDAAPDMLDWCQKKLDSEDLKTQLHAQAMHQLDLPRRYQTIVICGSFGLGGTRDHDLEGLRRIRAHLRPEGRLILDHHIPERSASQGELAAGLSAPAADKSTGRRSLQPWPEHGDHRRAADGSDLDLRVRLRNFNLATGIATREICVRQFIDDREVATETYEIDICVYSIDALRGLLESAGFSEIRITGGLEERPVHEGDSLCVFHATR